MNASVIMPYWERREVAEASLRVWREHEPPAEIIVVDDGSPTQPAEGLDAKVVALPIKTEPKTPTLPYNVGAIVAAHDIIVLSGCDIAPRQPLLEAMAGELREADYVLASVFSPSTNAWHCHTRKKTERFPKGYGPNFCAMIRRDYYFQLGGMDPVYRDGQAFDDTDFAWRLHEAGARVVRRDDLVCHHIKNGAQTEWPQGAHARNKKLFMERWDDCL
ncbi:glycosyltransferase [bacterium]|nr:glycosyltransferase [bacterium]